MIDKNVSEMYDDELVEYLGNQLDEIKAVTANITLDRLQEICNAERDGRCVVLPCKVGDTVYHDSGGFGILEYVIDGFVWDETGIIFQAASDSFGGDDVWECLDEIEFYGSDVGKTVFLTPEEAEKALEGGV